MSRTTYAPKESYTGNGATSAYTFDFKVEAKTQLLVVVLDDTGVEVERVRGNDLVYLSSVTLNTGGGGTVNLVANLTTDYTIYLLLANDTPTQVYEFRNKNSFTLKRFEDALDFILGAVQRLTFLSLGSLRISDTDDETLFDAQLPEGVASNGEAILQVNSAGTGFEFGISSSTIAANVAAAAASALAASNSETAAGVSETAAAASAVDAAASAAAALAASVGYTPSAVQTLGAAGEIVIVLTSRQHVRVKSSGGILALSTTPFGTDPALFQDGMEIVVECDDAANYHNLLELDGQYGFQGNGGLPLKFPNIITFLYNETKERFLVKSTGAF
jgi:hypothetical protein